MKITNKIKSPREHNFAGTQISRNQRHFCRRSRDLDFANSRFRGNAFSYNFDEIGNRTENLPNALNQPTIIGDFVPAFDADGNMISLQTATGTWEISWNAENRATRFECAGTQIVVECSYDSQGRRFEKIVTVAGTQILRERFIYRGFLQIAAFDVSEDSAGTPILTQKRTTFWDPTEPTATRPLALQIAGTGIYFPCVDLTKNVCELVDFSGTLAGTYDYSPFGEVSASANVPANPFQWSSEFYDPELALVYYNYRYYIPSLGRWLSEDPIGISGGLNLYFYCQNSPLQGWDEKGLNIWIENTDSVCGFHQRVCVDTWQQKDSTYQPKKDERTCCYEGNLFLKSGKYCISFARKDGEDFAYSSANNPSFPQNYDNGGVGKFPPNFGEQVEGANGIVYDDTKGEAKKITSLAFTSCATDMQIIQYFQSILNKESEYILARRNCRVFSQAVFDYIVEKYLQKK